MDSLSNFPILSPEDILASITLLAAFDESGKHNDCGHVVFGGFISTQEKWNEFTVEWNARLGRAGMRFLHTGELCDAYRLCEGQAKRNEIETLIGDLTAVVCKYALEGFVSHISVRDFKKLDQTQRKKYKDPFYYAFESGIKSIMQSTTLAPQNLALLVCDDSEEYSSECLKAYRRLKVRENKIAERIPGICFSDDKRYPPLQAADMFAYSYRRSITNPTEKSLISIPLEILMSHFGHHLRGELRLKNGEVV